MRLAFRHRNRLAGLNDAELADLLHRACSRYDEADKRRQATAMFWTPTRAAKYPGVYRFWTTLTGSAGFRVIEWTIKAMIVGSWRKGDPIEKTRLLVTDEATAMDHEIDEISAITKEIERRLTERQRGTVVTT